MPLTISQVKNAKPKQKAYKLSDAKGMYLEVMASGAKYWRMKYRYGGKEKRLSFGVYPDVSLKDAREKCDEAKRQLANDIDPGAVRRVQKLQKNIAAENSFEAIAREWYDMHMAEKSDSYRKRTWRMLEQHLFQAIGNRPVTEIKPPEILAVLKRIQKSGRIDTAHRCNQVAGMIFRYAIITGRADYDPCSALSGALQTAKVNHRPAIIDPKKVGSLMVAIKAYDGTPSVKSALMISPYVFGRPGEIRKMEWAEINWQKKQWELPPEKMKMGEPHIVPLAKQVLSILKEQQYISGRGRYVFPSQRGASRPLSDNGVRTALRTMGYDNDTMTPHGFRAMARTLLDEELGYPVHLIEHQLAHKVKDTTGRAYNRTTHLQKRRDMMQAWADYLDGLAEGVDCD